MVGHAPQIGTGSEQGEADAVRPGAGHLLHPGLDVVARHADRPARIGDDLAELGQLAVLHAVEIELPEAVLQTR